MNNKNKSKRYYWIKIKESFLTSETVDYLISQDGGNGFAYVVMYQCLCLKCINTNGKLERVINEVLIPYDFAKLKRDLKWFSLEQIQRAFELFARLGLIYNDLNGIISIADFDEIVGSESQQAIEKREQRSKERLLLVGDIQCPDNVCENVQDIVYQDNRDKILDIRDKIKEEEKAIYSPEKSDKLPYEEIVSYLNQKAKTNFRAASNATKTLIKARFNDKWTLDDFQYVIDIKCQEWLNTEQEKYLRPETLFGNKFENYRNQKQFVDTKKPLNTRNQGEVTDESLAKLGGLVL